MKPTKAMYLVGAFVFCVIAGAWIWWRPSYQEYMEAGFYWETLPLMAGVAMFLSWIGGIETVPTTLVVGSAFPAIILGRIVWDCFQDPTRHNLLPFELVFAFAFGMIMTFPLAWIGSLLRRITRRKLGNDGANTNRGQIDADA